MRFLAMSGSKNSLLIFLALVFLALILLIFMATGIAAQNEPDQPISINTDLIQTDVSVFDKNGHFVDDLTQDQFVLKIDGKPVRVDFFDKVVTTVNVNRESKQKTSDEGSQISLFERHIVFYIDDFHLSLDSLNRTRLAITHFIDYDMMPRDQVAIFTGSGNLGFLQQFTNNKTVLRAAVSRLRVYPNQAGDKENPPMSDYVAVRILNNDLQAAAVYIDRVLEGYNTRMVQPLTRQNAMEMVKVRANNIVTNMAGTTKNTLGSLENILQAIALYKGRKIVFLLSDGFHLESKQVPYSTTEALQRSINMATRAGASIYAIDARGLFSLASGDAAGEHASDMTSRGLDKGRVGEESDSQLGLSALADETGGKFLKNQNYFDKWVDKVIDENSSYYVLAWTPEKDEQLTKKFKSIDVDIVGRTDLKVRQQRGYLTTTEKAEAKDKENKKKNLTEIKTAEPAKTTAVKKILPVELALSYLDVPNVGGVLNSAVQVGAGDLSYGEKGDRPAKLYIEGTVFDIEGKQVTAFKNGVTLNPPARGGDPATASATASAAASFGRQSVIYGDKTPLPPGLYLVRARVGDMQTRNEGSAAQWIEIPDLSKKTLTLGSIFLGGKLIETAGKDGSVAAQFQFSVDHRFGRPVTLDFMSFIYNAARANTSNGSGDTSLSSRIEVLDTDGKAVIDTTMRPLATKGNADMARIPLRGSIKQNLNTAGTYLLRITVADNIAGTKTEQQAIFRIE